MPSATIKIRHAQYLLMKDERQHHTYATAKDLCSAQAAYMQVADLAWVSGPADWDRIYAELSALRFDRVTSRLVWLGLEAWAYNASSGVVSDMVWAGGLRDGYVDWAAGQPGGPGNATMTPYSRCVALDLSAGGKAIVVACDAAAMPLCRRERSTITKAG